MSDPGPGRPANHTMTDSLDRSLTLTKLQRPHAGRGVLQRLHLLERLNAFHSLTLIMAPAGYGKTTLLSTWLETCPMPSAWLSLDEHDGDLAIFVTYVVEALRTILPSVADTTLTAVNGATLPSPEMIARMLLNDLLAVQHDFVLVLDDYHFIRNPAIHDLLAEVVRHPPRILHLVIASRHDPPLPLVGLRARGNVTELRGPDLRFTLEESARFLVETMALKLDERAIAVLAAKTEGWPASLRLAALSLRQQQLLGMTATYTPDNNRNFMEYLVAEVLAQLPISVQEFLIKTSILEQLCSPLCEVVTGMVDRMFSGQHILEWLERADLFLASADDQQRWYRCHQLFRQLLRERLGQLHDPAEIAALHQRASAWFAGNGYLDEALHHALSANDLAAALQIVEQHRHDLMNQGQWQRLERWVNLFSREVIDSQPDLLLAEVWMKYTRQQLSAVPPLLTRVDALLPGLPPDRAEPLQSEVKSRRSALLYWSGDQAHSMALAQQALEKIPLEWWYIRGYTRLFVSAGFLSSGDLSRAYATLYTPQEPGQGRGYQNFLTGLACLVHWGSADLAGMMRAARQVLAGSDPLDRSEIVPWSQYHAGLYHYQRNELAAAETCFMPLVLQPYTSHALCFLNSAVLLARLRQLQGRANEAREIAGVMLSYALDTHSEVVLMGAQAFQAELALRQGRLAEAGQWAKQYGAFKRVPMPFAFIPPIVLAQILLEQDTAASRGQARQLLAEMDDYFTSIHYSSVQIQVHALQALIYHAEGQEQKALITLEKSIALAEPGRFLRLFVDLGAPLKTLLQKLAQCGVSPDYLAEILAAFDSGEAVPAGEQPNSAVSAPLSSVSAPLTNRELEVLRLLDKRYTDKEIAGMLSISTETVHTHVRHIGDKLGVRGRRAIAEAASDQGLLV